MRRSQSAIEYLTTYGWAILIIGIALAVLYSLNLFNPYTYAPKASAGSCFVVRTNLSEYNFPYLSGACTNELPQYVATFSNTSESYVYINPAPTLNIRGNVTILAWMKPYLNNYQWQGIISNRWPGSNVVQGYGFSYYQCTASIKCIYYSYNNGNSWVTYLDNKQLFSNDWVMIAVSRNMSSGEISFYQNGAFITSDPTNGLAASLDNPVAIGADPIYAPGSGVYFNGSIADVQIYNTTLSKSSIQALYQEGIGGAPINLNSLVGWWPLNGNANDYSGNQNNGVPYNVLFTSSWTYRYNAP